MSSVAKGALLQGWSWTTVEEIGETVTGTTPATNRPEFYGEALPFFKPTDLNAGYLVTDARQCLSEAGAEQARVLPIGTVLVTCIGATIGKTGLARVRCATNQQINALVPAASLRETKWLFWWFVGPEGQQSIQENSSSTTLPILNKSRFNKLQAAIPPLPEQYRIVEAIESYFTRLDDAVATLERVERNLKRYRASVLKSAVEGRLVPTEAALAKQEGRDYEPASVLLERILTERRRRWAESGKKGKYQEPVPPDTTNLPELPEGWCWTTLNSIADIQLGQQRAPIHASAPTQLPYIRAANITWAGLDIADVKSMGFPNPERYRLEYGDVLLSEASGSPMEAGKPAIWRDEIAGACYQKTLLRIRPFSKTLVLPEFLRAIFLRDCLTGKFARAAPGVGIVHLTAERMFEWPVPLAPMVEQRRIAMEVDHLESTIESSSRSLAKQSVRVNRLRQSILKWAFEGKLADQDPTDEPASVLLDRIKAERDQTQPARKKSRA